MSSCQICIANRAGLPLTASPPVNAMPKPMRIGSAARAGPGIVVATATISASAPASMLHRRAVSMAFPPSDCCWPKHPMSAPRRQPIGCPLRRCGAPATAHSLPGYARRRAEYELAPALEQRQPRLSLTCARHRTLEQLERRVGERPHVGLAAAVARLDRQGALEGRPDHGDAGMARGVAVAIPRR